MTREDAVRLVADYGQAEAAHAVLNDACAAGHKRAISTAVRKAMIEERDRLHALRCDLAIALTAALTKAREEERERCVAALREMHARVVDTSDIDAAAPGTLLAENRDRLAEERSLRAEAVRSAIDVVEKGGRG